MTKRTNLKLPKKGEIVNDGLSDIRCLAYAEGYVMCRRKGCIVYAMTLGEWDAYRSVPQRERTR